jgi:beta-galactosidase/beta-glucuronidase
LRRTAWQSLNGEWEFGAGAEPVFDRTILVPFCPECSLSGVGERVGDVVWYRRSFEPPGGDRLMLHFGAVDYSATVWVNDVEVARHEGGHAPFSAEITGALLGRENVITVRAEDRLDDRTVPRGKQYWTETPEGIFYVATTGIWQSVWLEPVPAAHIRGLRLRGDLVAGAVDFEVEADGDVEVVALFDGQVVGAWSGSAGEGRLQLDRVVPWHPDSPRLYDLEARLLDRDGKVGDRVESYFGLRTVEARDGRVWLNGEPFVERLVLDQGYWADGLLTAPSDDDLRRDVELAQALGFNGARKHQKAEDPRWLHWADRLGFLVWAEMPSFHEFTAEAARRLTAEWTELVVRDRDHPSVVAWVVANESFGLDRIQPAVRAEFTSNLYEVTRRLDATRPIVSNDGWEHSRSDLCTLHDYSPPQEMAPRYRTVDRALDGAGNGHPPFDPGFAYEGQPILVSEFGGLRVAGTGGWGWLEVRDETEFLSSYRALVDALMEAGPVEGFCYTQLTDVQQEQNGLLTARREPKVDPEQLRPLTQAAKRR